MAFDRGNMSEDWRTTGYIPLYEDKGEMTECKNYTDINLLSMIGKNYE